MLRKVISGGQTGADRAGLEAAKFCNLETGGTAPKNYMTEDGSDYTLKDLGLVEGPKGYVSRTMMNVDNSDATIVFRFHPSSGTDKTIGYCLYRKWITPSVIPINNWNLYEDSFSDELNSQVYECYKPLFIVDSLPLFSLDELSQHQLLIKSIKNFLLKNNVRTLNVAGHRASSSKSVNFYDSIRTFLIEAFHK